MKEQYIKQVEKELSLTRKAKKEVVRDLNEVFASALEHGETEQQVIERLGTPKEFAENTAEQLGIDSAAPQKTERDYFERCSPCRCRCSVCDLRHYPIRESAGRGNRTSRRNDKHSS